MHRILAPRVWRWSVVVILMFTLSGLMVSAQGPDLRVEEASTAEQGPPTVEEFEWTGVPPTLTEEQRGRLEYWADYTHLPGPVLDEQGVVSVGPLPGTESVLKEEGTPSAPQLLQADAKLWRAKVFDPAIPAGLRSNAMGTSVGIGGMWGFFTGNWFAARTANSGQNWAFVDPFAGFPEFCCDQITLYDESRNIFLWLRTGFPDANGENVFKLTVFPESPKNPSWTYDTAPVDVDPGWTHQRWDYPHIQLGADYVYIAWNMLDWNGTPDPDDDYWVRTVMLRWPLDDLAAGTGFSHDYYATSEWFTFVPVQGAYHTMYWASNWPTTTPQNCRIGIWKWQEDEVAVYSWHKTITCWDFTDRGDAECPPGGDPNWAARSDQRVLTGARYSVNSPGIVDDKILGRKILGWWWNVRQGQFTLPYIDGAAFFESTMEQLPGWLGRPYMWNYDYCFAYPSITPNKRQDLGAAFNYAAGDNSWKPRIGYAIADDYVWAPPGWDLRQVARSKALPSDNVWGGYNTVREFEPTQKVWVASAHFIRGTTDCSDCAAPMFFVFGRERDFESWRRWRLK